MGHILSSSDVHAVPCLVSMCGWLLSSCVMGVYSYCSEGTNFICGGSDPFWLSFADSSSFVVVVVLFSSCDSVLFSDCDGGYSSPVVMRRGIFSSCDVPEATLCLLLGWPLLSWGHVASSLVAVECSSQIVVGQAPLGNPLELHQWAWGLSRVVTEDLGFLSHHCRSIRPHLEL